MRGVAKERKGTGKQGSHHASLMGVSRKNEDGSYFGQQGVLCYFLEHKAARGLLNLHCFPGSQGSGKVQHRHYLPLFFHPSANQARPGLVKLLQLPFFHFITLYPRYLSISKQRELLYLIFSHYILFYCVDKS